MRISLWDKRFIYMAGHQVLTVVLAICVFSYDYLLRIPGEQNEIAYMMIGFLGLLGSIASLAAFTVTENQMIRKQRKKSGLDKLYLEVVIFVFDNLNYFYYCSKYSYLPMDLIHYY